MQKLVERYSELLEKNWPLEGEERHPVRHVDVGADAAGQRIDNFLLGYLKTIPRSRVYQMLRKGEVRVNGRRVKPTHRLVTQDRVRIPPVTLTADHPRALAGRRLLARLERAIVLEDDHLLVLDKPSGVAVHGGSGISVGVIEALRQLRPGVDLELVHRLDRETSGCLLIAKDRATLVELHRRLRERSVVKRYALLVHGTWPRGVQTVRLPLLRYVTASGERRVRVSSEGRPSRTDFQIQRAGRRVSWLRARLHTGRTHQIRVHAAASGHPVVGDDKYARTSSGGADPFPEAKRLCLHAEELRLQFRDSELRFRCPVPGEFQQLWQLVEDADTFVTQHGRQRDERQADERGRVGPQDGLEEHDPQSFGLE